MPLPVRFAGRSGHPQWPLAAAWAVSVASLLVIALVPRTAAHAYGTFLLAGSAGSLTVVLVYARLLRRGAPPPRTVLLVGGPWQGRMLLARTGPMPEEIQLAGPEAVPCSYRRRAGDRDRPQLRVLRYEPGDGTGPAASL
jgi:hypothetical protein